MSPSVDMTSSASGLAAVSTWCVRQVASPSGSGSVEAPTSCRKGRHQVCRSNMEMVEAYALGAYRIAAALAGCDHGTVKRYVERRDAGLPAHRGLERGSIIDVFRPKLEEWVGRDNSRFVTIWCTPSCGDGVHQNGSDHLSGDGGERVGPAGGTPAVVSAVGRRTGRLGAVRLGAGSPGPRPADRHTHERRPSFEGLGLIGKHGRRLLGGPFAHADIAVSLHPDFCASSVFEAPRRRPTRSGPYSLSRGSLPT
jgi:hypothetical protein